MYEYNYRQFEHLVYLAFALQATLWVMADANNHCYTCFNIKDPSQCNKTTSCDKGQSCVVTETVTPSLELAYHLGCVSNDHCNTDFEEVAVGRKRSIWRRTLKHNCCDGHLCNNRTIDGGTQQTTPPPCTDTDSRCADFTFILSICYSPSEAHKCAKSCKVC